MTILFLKMMECAVFFRIGHANSELARSIWLPCAADLPISQDRKSTRLNSSHANISYAVFCLKKKKAQLIQPRPVNALLAYVPGICFYAAGSGPEHMRFSYLYPQPLHIRAGVGRPAPALQADV